MSAISETSKEQDTVSRQYKISCQGFYKTLKGEDTQTKLWEAVGEAIAATGAEQANKAELKPGKLIAWAQVMVRGEELTLDQTDFDSLRRFVGLLPMNLNILHQADEYFRLAATDTPEK